jgi:hypothetical protein
MFIYAFLLFFVLTPGVLVYLPPKGSKMVVAAVHALVFAIVWTFTNKLVWKATAGLFEGYSGNLSYSEFDHLCLDSPICSLPPLPLY